ncbi:MAG: SMP-30/gluconolactonase/LRE family protein [Rhodanobacter sp.]
MSMPPPDARLIPLPGSGPEDVVVDAEGRLVAGVEDGRLLQVDPRAGEVHVVARLDGRPLGLEILADGNILACVSPGGVVRIDPADGTVVSLISSFADKPLAFCSNVVAAADGSIFVSTSSARYTFAHWRRDIVEHIASGVLLHRHADGRVEMLLDGLQFGNGLALARDESFIIVAETNAARLLRYWLKGPSAGQHEVFAELPGYPDNLSMSPNGLVWVALVSSHNALRDKIHQLPLFLRKLIARLPESLQPAPEKIAWVMALNPDGSIARDYCWKDGCYSMVTGVCQHGNTVYLGSMTERAVLAFDLPAPKEKLSGTI